MLKGFLRQLELKKNLTKANPWHGTQHISEDTDKGDPGDACEDGDDDDDDGHNCEGYIIIACIW